MKRAGGPVRVDEVVWTPRLGEHLERFRTRAGLRRVDLADRLSVSEETIRLWERGAVQPSPDRLERLIALLAVEGGLWGQTDLEEREVDDDLPPLARRLRDERRAVGLTQATVAVRLGVAQATYAGWETGRSTPAAQHLSAVADHLGVPLPKLEALLEAPIVVDYAGWPPFGRLVGAARERLRLTRTGLAERLGVTPRAIASWELGYRRPDARQVAELAAAVRLEASVLADALPKRSAPSRLGELILTRQRELGLRSRDLADLVGTTESTMSRWINGHSRPGHQNLRRLAEALRLPSAEVLQLAGDAL